MKKLILVAGTIAASMLSAAAQAHDLKSQQSSPYNVAVHQAVAALLNAQVVAAVKDSNASEYRAETLIAQSLEWPTADLAEAWLSQNPNLTIPQAVKVALLTEIHMRITQLENDNAHGVIPFPDDNEILITKKDLPQGLPPSSVKIAPYFYITGPYGSWEPVPMAVEEAEIGALSPK